MLTLPALLAVNILAWLIVLVYTFRLIPALARRWNAWLALGGALAAAVLSLVSYNQAAKLQVRQQALKHYWAGLDEKKRGNLEEAERQFEKSLSIQPGNPEAEKEIQEIRQQKPAEQREQRKEARVEAPPSQPPQTTPPAPAQNAPAQNATAQNSPPPTAGKEGEKPRPTAHLPSPFEITHYGLDVDLVPAAHTLSATAEIRVRSRGQAVPRLDFSLNPEFKPSEVRFDGAPAPFTHVNDLLSVTPAKPVPAQGEATVTVRYARKGGPIVGKGEALIAAQGTYFLSESRWYPATGELDFRSPVSVRAHVPKGYTVVSVGALKEKKVDPKGTLFHWATDKYASMVSLAAAKYEQQSVRVPLDPVDTPGKTGTAAPLRRELSVTCYTFPQHKNRAQLFLKEAATITRFYERRFGPYPYEKLGVVEIPLFPGGYGTTSFVMLIDQSFEEKKIDREFVAHEIAHQWWGNSVFPQGLGAAWLTEAFANYSAWMYEASVTGNPRVLQKRVARAVQEYYDATAREGDQPIYETDPYQPVGATQEILYEKGAVVLHMLRHEIGDKAFFRTLRAFADQYRFGLAKIEDFRAVAERESGKDLGWFFDEWLGRKGGMTLSYRFETLPDTPQQNQGLLTVTQPSPAYRVDRMKVVLQVDNTAVTREIQFEGERKPISIPVKGKLLSVRFDPQGWYLMRPPQWVVADNRR